MSGGGGSGSSSTTVQKADPWSGVQPGLMSLYGSAGTAFNAGGPQVYQGSSVAPLNSTQTQALSGLSSVGSGGLGPINAYQKNALDTANMQAGGQDMLGKQLTNYAMGQGDANGALASVANGQDASSKYLQSVLNPEYLNVNNNPSLQAAMNAANQNTTRNFNTAVMPGLASQFSAAGRFGSGAQSQGISDATNNLATQISGTNAGMASSAWSQLVNNQLGAAGTLGGLKNQAAGALSNSEMNAANIANSRQNTAMGMVPAMSQAGASNANIGLGAGTAQQTQDQATLADIISRFNATQQQPYNNLNWYSNILNGGMTLNGSSSTQTGGGASPLQSGLGGALGGAAIGGQLGGGYGAAIGGVGGGLLGLL